MRLHTSYHPILTLSSGTGFKARADVLLLLLLQGLPGQPVQGSE
jgi:hypothetical protein